MGKTGAKLPSFCLNRIRPHVRVPIQSKPDYVSAKTGPNKKIDDCSDEKNDHIGVDQSNKGVMGIGRKIMIVVDSTIEAEGALHWALSHTVQIQDNILLLHVTKPSSKGPNSPTFSLSLFLFHILVLNFCLKCGESVVDSVSYLLTIGEGPNKETAPRAYELVHSMRTLCQLKRPEVMFCSIRGNQKLEICDSF